MNYTVESFELLDRNVPNIMTDNIEQRDCVDGIFDQARPEERVEALRQDLWEKRKVGVFSETHYFVIKKN